jgi:hypothetical protein
MTLTREQFVKIQNHWIDLKRANPELVVIKNGTDYITHTVVTRTLQWRNDDDPRVQVWGYEANANKWIATLYHSQKYISGKLTHTYFISVWNEEDFTKIGGNAGIEITEDAL